MKLNAALSRQLRADYVAFLKQEGVTEEDSHSYPLKMGAAIGKTLRKHAPSLDEPELVHPFRKFFERTFKNETAVIRRGSTSGTRENPGQAPQAAGSGG